MSTSDSDLLQEYVRDGSQPAFATLVGRHLDLVYSAARRQVGSSHLAEEVAQSVFIDLARNARAIPAGTPLVAWLHVVSRRTAIDVIRRESRRQSREHQAAELARSELADSIAMKSNSPEWEGIAPLLDEAVESLAAADRAAILLRYFENKSLRDVGAALGTSEDTAQKRVSRAVEQLRRFLLRRGVTISAGGLAADLSAHALQTAPAGLGTAIFAAAGAFSPAAVGTVAATLTMSTLQKSLITGVLLAAFGGIVFETQALRAQRAELSAVRTLNEDLSAQARRLRQQQAVVARRSADPSPTPAARVPTPADATLEAEMSAWLDRAARLKRLRDERPDLAIPELSALPDETYFRAARDQRCETEEEIRQAFANLRRTAERSFMQRMQGALRGYLLANNGLLPTSTAQLAAFFDAPVQPEALRRYEMRAGGKLADVDPKNQERLIEQNSPADWERDLTYTFGLNGTSSTTAFDARVREAIDAYATANQGAKPTLPEHILAHLPRPVDPGRLKSYLTPRP